MTYDHTAIADNQAPRASSAVFQHTLETYASETNKVISVWRGFSTADLAFRPHPRSSSVLEIFKGLPEPQASEVRPTGQRPEDYAERLLQLTLPRLGFLACRSEAWWLGRVRLFDVERERIWVFWRRVLHTAHHRTQLTVIPEAGGD